MLSTKKFLLLMSFLLGYSFCNAQELQSNHLDHQKRPLQVSSLMNKNKHRFLYIYTGHGDFIVNDNNDSNIHSFILKPVDFEFGTSISIHYITSFDKQYHFTEKSIFIHPTINDATRYFGAELGLSLFAIRDYAGIIPLVLPTLSVKAGNMKKYFISINVFTELYWEFFSANAHYYFKDQRSKILLGLSYDGGGDFQGYKFAGTFNIWKSLTLSTRGLVNPGENHFNYQVGVGMIY